MTRVFHAGPRGRFTEIKSSLRRKKHHRKNRGFNFLGGSFSSKDNVKASTHFEDKYNPSISQDDLLSGTGIHFYINSTTITQMVK